MESVRIIEKIDSLYQPQVTEVDLPSHNSARGFYAKKKSVGPVLENKFKHPVHHFQIQVSNIQKSALFYGELLGRLGFAKVFEAEGMVEWHSNCWRNRDRATDRYPLPRLDERRVDRPSARSRFTKLWTLMSEHDNSRNRLC